MLKKRCHSCFKTENLVPCRGNVERPCRKHNYLCDAHSRVIDSGTQCLD
jgi:hypothetical protein